MGFVLFIGCVAYEKYCCSIFEGKCYTFILRTRIVWIFLHKQPATQTTSVLFWDVSLKNTEVKLSLSFPPVTPSPLIALHRPQFNEAISFAGTPMQNKCAVLINTGCLIAILPWNFASFIYIMLGAVIVTLPCPVSRIPSAAQSAHPLVWYHSGTVLGHWCQMPVMRTHIAPVSIIPDGKRRKGENVFSVCTLRHEGKKSDHESLRCWLMGFKQHNTCACNATHNSAQRDEICRPGSPSCVDVPLSHGTPAALKKHPALLLPFIASRRLSPVFLIHICLISFNPFSSFHVLFILIFQGNCLLFTDSLSSGWRDNVHGRQGHAASLCHTRWLFNAVCLLNSFLSLGWGGLRWWRCSFLSPLEGQIVVLCH